MRKIRLIGLAVFFCLLFCNAALATETVITFLHSNDIHSHLVPYDDSRYGENVGGIVRRAEFIRQQRLVDPEILILDAGDILQGTPFYNMFKGEASFKTVLAAGLDATTLGNHELDDGLANLKTQIEKSGVRLLCANVFFANSSKEVFQPYHIFEVKGKKIAVIGAIGDEAWESIDRKIRASMYATPKIPTLKKVAQQLRSEVDFIVALTHSGNNHDIQLAAEVTEIDLVIGGHSHTTMHRPELVLNNTDTAYDNGQKGTIVTQAGRYGAFVGKLSISLAENGKIASFSGELIKITAEFEPDEPTPTSQLLENYQQELTEIMSQIAGHSDTGLAYPKKRSKTEFLPMGNFVAEAMCHVGQSDICILNSGGIRCELASGDITWGHIYESLPYDNSVVTFTLKGCEVQNILDFIAAGIGEHDGYQIAGIQANLNIISGKASDIKIRGQNLDLEKEYRVSTSSFVANGNLGGDIMFANIISVEDSGIFMRDAAIEFLKTMPDIDKFNSSHMEIVK